MLIRAQALFFPEFCSRALNFLSCFLRRKSRNKKQNACLRATSIASFLWRLAINETNVLPLSSSGICASVSETGVRWGAERETGEEWEALPRGAPQPEKGEGNLPEAGEHSAGGIRSEMSGQLWTRPQDVQQLYLENNTILTDVFLHSLL